MPGSRDEWPASGTMCSVISGQTFFSSYAVVAWQRPPQGTVRQHPLPHVHSASIVNMEEGHTKSSESIFRLILILGNSASTCPMQNVWEKASTYLTFETIFRSK